MKCDHVVKVVVLRKTDTTFSSIPGRMNLLVLVKSDQIFGFNLDNNGAINKLNKCMKYEEGKGHIFFQEHTYGFITEHFELQTDCHLASFATYALKRHKNIY